MEQEARTGFAQELRDLYDRLGAISRKLNDAGAWRAASRLATAQRGVADVIVRLLAGTW